MPIDQSEKSETGLSEESPITDTCKNCNGLENQLIFCGICKKSKACWNCGRSNSCLVLCKDCKSVTINDNCQLLYFGGNFMTNNLTTWGHSKEVQILTQLPQV